MKCGGGTPCYYYCQMPVKRYSLFSLLQQARTTNPSNGQPIAPTKPNFKDAKEPNMHPCHTNSAGKESMGADRASAKPIAQSGAPTGLDESYPDGDIIFQTTKDTVHCNWATMMCHSYDLAAGGARVHRKCLGVVVCEECDFTARPRNPATKRANAPPKLPNYTCPKHPFKNLKPIECTGGTGKYKGQACRLTLTSYPDGSVTVQHFGTHNHPKPPPKEATPQAMAKLREMVTQRPDYGAAKMKAGYVGGNFEPITKLDPVFNNIDKVNYIRLKILKQTGADGIQASTGALLQFLTEVPHSFIVKVDFTPGKQIIAMQTKYMKQVINESMTACQTDTVEGEIEDFALR